MTYITNDCLALFIYKELNQQYESPLIGSLFESDLQYLKFCENFDHYINLTPRFGDPLLPVTEMDYKNVPVMFLDDIEIHFPHETDKDILLGKWNRRKERMTKPIFIWSDMQIFNKDYSLKEQFKKLPNSIYVNKDDIEEHKDKEFVYSKEGYLNTVCWLDYPLMAKHIIKLL